MYFNYFILCKVEEHTPVLTAVLLIYRDKLDDPRMLTTVCVLLGLNFTMAGDGDIPMDTTEPPPTYSSRPKEPEKRKEPSEDLSSLSEGQKQVP